MFYRETNFQKTSIGKIPKDWQIKELKDIGTFQYGYTASAENEDTGVKFLRITDIEENGGVDWNAVPYCSIDKKGYKKYELKAGDVLFARIGATAGKTSYIDIKVEGIFASYLIRFQTLKGTNSKYVFYFTQSKLYWSQALRQREGQLKKGMNANTLSHLRIATPNTIGEQERITEILSSIDDTLNETREIIAKTERLKQGLMQELLAKGMGHKEFKNNKELAAKIPKEWEIVELNDVAEINKENRDPTQKPSTSFVYIDIESVGNGTGVINEPKEIMGGDAPSRARRVVHENDVIMSTVRPYLKAFALIPKEIDNEICSTGFAVLSCKESLEPHYLLYVIFSDLVINQCNKMMVGAQYPALNESQVSKIKIPFPPLKEQQKISEILSATDEKLEIERAEKERLERIKQGLMDVLLTGRVRVKV